MADKPEKRKVADTPTGIFPRPTAEELRERGKENPEPRQMPEFDDGEAITGVWPVHARREGEDSAKSADDNPTKSASKNE